MFRIFLRLVAVIQIVLGLAYAFAPAAFLASMGHSPLPPDLAYPLSMLAARFLMYGAGLWLISRAPGEHLLWIRLMGGIQLIDLSGGLFHTLAGNVSWAHSGFPMFNALWIAIPCLLWKPQHVAQTA